MKNTYKKNKQKIIDKFKINFRFIITLSLSVAGSLFTILSILSTFISWSDIGVNKPSIRIIILLGILVLSFIIGTVLAMFILKSRIIWTKGNNTVRALYGDLFKIGFKMKHKRIVVIPVNDTFETIIENPGEKVLNPLVSSKTIHGKWVEAYLKDMEITREDLNERIKEDLSLRNIEGIELLDENIRLKGNTKSYPIGIIASINGKRDCVFYLLVISKFDFNNNAQSTKKNIWDAIESLICFYDKNGQGYPLYIPLMGTGRSRAGLTHNESFDILKSNILKNDSSINGELNLVVYDKDRHEVSIFQ